MEELESDQPTNGQSLILFGLWETNFQIAVSFLNTKYERGTNMFFLNYTIHRRHSQHMHTHPYEYTHTNPTPRSIFEECAGKSSRLTKSPQAPRCRRERRLPLKAQTPLNLEKFAPTRSRTQDLKCYRGSCMLLQHNNHL
jgi:hypothetical protein